MGEKEFRVFISAVTREFGDARNELAADLRARDLLLRVQSDFRQEPGSSTLLEKLHDYIKECTAVVCIVGKLSGSSPTPDEAAPFKNMLLNGISEASYTQWELFFARHYKRRCSIYLSRDDANPDPLQKSYVAYLKGQGFDRSSFSGTHELCRSVLKEPWPNEQRAKPIVLPYPSIGALFKGRDEFLVQLRNSLKRQNGGPTAIVSSLNIRALYGLGGIGKTRAAVEYAWARRDDYNALLFVIAETPQGLRTNLAALIGVLVPSTDTTDDNVRLQAVLDWLKRNPGWLLILDNLDTPEAMAEAERLVSGLSGGHLVMTSRLSNFPAHVKPLQLDVLSLDEASAFLLDRTDERRRNAPDDAAQARGIATDVGQLALALEQAAAYVGHRKLTFAQYRELWRASHDHVMAWSDPAITKYPRAVAVTWRTSVSQLTDAGRRLLERLAWLAPEPIPDFLLDEPIPEAEPGNLHDALADLAAYSLVTRDAGSFFLVHRLVQDVTRRSLAVEKAPQTLIDALRWMTAAFPFDADDVRFWPKAEPLTPHARAVADYAESAAIAEPTASLLNQLALLFKAKAIYAEAEALCRRALEVGERSIGSDHPVVAIRLNNLAELLRATNRLAEAEPLYRRALAIHEKSCGPDNSAVATDLNNLAALLANTKRLAEAEPLYRRALEINEKTQGPDHPDVANSLNSLATLLVAKERLAEAEPLFRRALQIVEKTNGPDHPAIAISLNNLAQLLSELERLAEAEPPFRRALAINEKSYGLEHPAVATSLSNLAGLLFKAKGPAEAEPLYRRALAIDEKSYGLEHPAVAIHLLHLAFLLSATNQLAEAEPLSRRQLAIFGEFNRQTGYEHPYFETAIENYAGILEALGKSQPEIETTLISILNPSD